MMFSRLRRIFRGFMAIKSVILGAAILALWVRSYRSADTIVRGDATQSIGLTSAAGRVLIEFLHDGQPTRIRASWHRESSRQPADVVRGMPVASSIWGKLGFGFNTERFTAPNVGMRVDILAPHWAIFLLAMPSAILWMLRNWRLRPRKGGAISWCPRCLVATGAFGTPSLSRH